MENDFGMPFLYLLHHDPIRLNNAIDLIQILASNPTTEEIKLVNDFSNIITNTSGADLSPDDKVSNGNILEK